jgi:hypothetical protein
MIIFETVSQAKNFVSKQQSQFHVEDCGCCGYDLFTKISNKRVLKINSGFHKGFPFMEVEVIGRIKHVK